MAAAPPPDPARTRRRAYKGISGGVTLISIGSVLLLNTLGVVGWGVWFELLKLWPLVLVSLGVRWIFVNTRVHLFCLIGPAVIALGTFWVVSTYREGAETGPEGMAGGEMIPVDCAPPAGGGPARLDLDFAAGDMRFIAEQVHPSARGFHGTLRYRGREPRYSCEDGSGTLRLRPYAYGNGIHFVLPLGNWQNRWEARLATSSPVHVDMKVAASNADLDLRAFTLQRVEIDAAASRLQVQLGPARGRVPVRIDGAVDELRLVIPQGTCFTVSRERVLNVLDVDDSVHRDNRWRRLTSDACASVGPDTPRYEIRYELPVSSVTIEIEGRPT